MSWEARSRRPTARNLSWKGLSQGSSIPAAQTLDSAYALTTSYQKNQEMTASQRTPCLTRHKRMRVSDLGFRIVNYLVLLKGGSWMAVSQHSWDPSFPDQILMSARFL